jgi:hypothetical protein
VYTPLGAEPGDFNVWLPAHVVPGGERLTLREWARRWAAACLPRLERFVFGASAEEAVRLRRTLIDRRVDRAFERLMAGLADGDGGQDDDEDGGAR